MLKQNIAHAPEISQDRLELLQRMPKQAVCAEIGVWKGEFSKNIIHHTQPEKLVLIDPWAFQPEFPNRMFGGKVAKEQGDMDAIYQSVCLSMVQYNTDIVRKTSIEAAADFEDETFDWVYIDGNHYYDFVCQDLEAWFPKVKPGGFLTGDDYLWQDESGTCSVAKAVSHFLQSTPVAEANSIINQFIIQKPA